MKHGVLHMPNQPNGYAVRISAQAGRHAYGLISKQKQEGVLGFVYLEVV